MSINRVTITGNLTRDPELRSTAGGTAILAMGVAVNDRWRNPQTNQWEDRPNYIDCVVFGNRAQSLANILHKGMKVAVEGRLRWSQWQDRETGKNRSKIEVVVDDVEFMSQRGEGGYNQQPNYQQGGGYNQQQPPAMNPPQQGGYSASVPDSQPQPAPSVAPPSAGVYDDEIPF